MLIAWGALASALALVLVSAAYRKISDFGGFAETVGGYRLAPATATKLVAAVLLTAELGAAGLLLAAPWVGGAGFAPAAVLFAIYALAVAINLARGRTEIDCGCGWGERGAGITRLHAGRPLALAFAAFVGAVGAPAAAPSAAVVAGALLLAAPFVVVYLAADVLIENDARLAAGR